MTRMVTLLSLAMLGRLAPAAGPELRLTVALEFGSAAGVELQSALRSEVRRAIPLDWLGIDWRELRSVANQETFDRIVIVRVRGTCTGPSDAGSRALGITHGVRGRVLPFIEIDCNRVAGILSRLPSSGSPVVLGRALGRVLAHELYHVLGETAAHAEEGLAQPCFGLRELTARRLAFLPEDLQRIEARLRGPALTVD